MTTAAKPKAVATLKIQAATVSVKKKGASDFKPAKDGQKLHEGDTVQTDATGLAEVDYSDDSYTRLDVSTTLKIVKLSDDQGNRQVETSVDAGRTWNRTAALTESQSFEQSGAGATAAVVGTAFAVECDPIVAPATTSAHCTTIAVIHTTEWTGADGTKIDLGPYQECDATEGVICGAPTTVTEFDEWIQHSLQLDLLLRGLPGPISGVVSFENGHVTFTPTATTPTTGGTTPVEAPSIDQTCPVLANDDGSSGSDPVCNPSSSLVLSASINFVPSSKITAEDEEIVYFLVHQSGATTVGISALPTNGTGTVCAPVTGTGTHPCTYGPGSVLANYDTITTDPTDPNNTTKQYAPDTQFAFAPADHETPVDGTFTETATNSGGTTSETVPVQVYEGCDC